MKRREQVELGREALEAIGEILAYFDIRGGDDRAKALQQMNVTGEISELEVLESVALLQTKALYGLMTGEGVDGVTMIRALAFGTCALKRLHQMCMEKRKGGLA